MHRFSHSTMPLVYIFRKYGFSFFWMFSDLIIHSSAHYWIFGGLMSAVSIYGPWNSLLRTQFTIRDENWFLGTCAVLWLVCALSRQPFVFIDILWWTGLRSSESLHAFDAPRSSTTRFQSPCYSPGYSLQYCFFPQLYHWDLRLGRGMRHDGRRLLYVYWFYLHEIDWLTTRRYNIYADIGCDDGKMGFSKACEISKGVWERLSQGEESYFSFHTINWITCSWIITDLLLHRCILR